jgi:eukaryotic-like serine/threonine-protein kinase
MLEPNQIFAGRYRVLRTLAQGGMGIVFEAEHTGTEQRVALKVLYPHIMRVASVREKFELEAKVAARVKNEHIVHVLDAGFDDATRSPYLVMELLNGTTLSARVTAEGRIGSQETVTLLRQVARGLDAAHAFRDNSGQPTPIVHRDLKPDNLILHQRADGSPLVKILDFGIAKVLSETRNVSHEVRGTPIFMAYEQVAAARLSPQTDIWALGLIAYYVLTGKPYWKTAEDPNASLPTLFAEIAHWPMAPASVRMKEQGLAWALPAAFDAWLAQCLDRVAERRFGSAGAAIDALELALRGVHSRGVDSRGVDSHGATEAAAPMAAVPLAPGLAAAGPLATPPALTRTPTELSVPPASASSTSSSLPAIASVAFGSTAARAKPRLVLPGIAATALIGAGALGWALFAGRSSPTATRAPAAASSEVRAALPAPEQHLAPPATATTAAPPSPSQEAPLQAPVSHDAKPAIVVAPEAVQPAEPPAPATPKTNKPKVAGKPKVADKPKAAEPPTTTTPRVPASAVNPFDVR